MTRSSSVFFIGLLIISALSDCHSQVTGREFGDINSTDFMQTEQDTSSAIILFNIGNARVETISGTTLERRIRYRILKRSAIDEWGGNFKFLINKRGFTKPKGVTCNLENGVIQKFQLPDEAIKRKKINKEFDEVSIAFTNVKVGSIIDFQYTLRSEDTYFPTWEFQSDIPTVWSEFTISAQAGDYMAHLRGPFKPLKYEEKYDGKYRHWLMKNIPAFHQENLMPDPRAFKSSVRFATRFKSWGEICNYLMLSKRFGGVLEYHNFLESEVDAITEGMTDSIQMVKAISTYIKDKIQFNDVYSYFADDPKEVLERKYGSAGDINLLYAAMLKKAGFNVKLVLLSTRDNGFLLEDFTSLSQMNYVVCMIKVNQKQLYLDATEKKLSFDILPARCLNHKGFLVSQTEFGWIGIEPTQQDRIVVESNLTLLSNGLVKGQVKNTKAGYAAFSTRETFHDLGEEKYKERMTHNIHWDVNDYKIQNIENLEKPVLELFEVSSVNYATVKDDIIYINPHAFLREESNPLTGEQRVYPIDFEMLIDHQVISNITIPHGYEAENIPENKVLLLPDGKAKCTFSFTIKDNVIAVMTRLQINRTWFSSEEYSDLREFYARIISRKSEVIVLKKI